MKKELSQIKHARSAKQFPDIKLDENEYVVIALQRSKLGIGIIWVSVALCAIILTVAVFGLLRGMKLDNSYLQANHFSVAYLWLGVIALYALLALGGWLGQMIYKGNALYVTNHRAIQKTRSSLFAISTNVIELKRIEDVSFRQENIWDHIFQVGTLRMSTVGDETTYTFSFVDVLTDELDTISQLVSKQRAK